MIIDGTQLRVSRCSFGTASLHHLFSARQRRRLLDQAADAGFSHFDTSPYYGFGLAESDLGRFFNHKRDRFTVATKVGIYPNGTSVTGALDLWLRKGASQFYKAKPSLRVDWSVAEAARSLEASLARMQTDYVDVAFLHEPQPELIDADEFLRWLERELSRGRIRAWGLAGDRVPSIAWVRDRHPLAQVLQVKDSLDGCEADALAAHGRSLQFTYGYFSGLAKIAGIDQAKETIAGALRRNRTGSIVVSTRRAERLASFVAGVESERCR